MKAFLLEPARAFWLGCAVAALGLAFWFVDANNDDLGLISFLARFVHIGAAMLWVGMIWFVNFIQLAALQKADAAGRSALLVHVVPRVTALFGMASHVVVASGALLLFTTGYLFDRWVFPSSVYMPPLRSVLLWLGVLAGLGMWGLVHAVIKPALAIVRDEGQSAEAVASARGRILMAARVNLVLAVPVTFAMVAATHLY